MVTEILAVEDVIAPDLYEDLSRVRKARNEWIHGTADRVQMPLALTATSACERLFEQTLGLAVQGQKAGKLHGYTPSHCDPEGSISLLAYVARRT